MVFRRKSILKIAAWYLLHKKQANQRPERRYNLRPAHKNDAVQRMKFFGVITRQNQGYLSQKIG
jgi:hypothetical protein